MNASPQWQDDRGRDHPKFPVAIDPARTLLVTDCDPIVWSVSECLGAAPRVVVLPDAPLTPLPGAAYFTFRPGTNPLQWDQGVEDSIRDLGLDTAVFHTPAPIPAGKTLLRLRRLGVRRVILLGENQVYAGSPFKLTLRRLAARCWRMVRDRVRPPREATAEQYRAALARVGSHWPTVELGPTLRVAHFVTALHTGAERQGSYAAIIQNRRGHDTRVLSRLPLRGLEAHDRALLDAEEVPVRSLGEPCGDRALDAWLQRGLRDEHFRMIPPEMRVFVLNLVVDLLAAPVDVLHCYVDDCNIVGAIAGILAGVPGIVLSFRNDNPSYFPRLYRPWMLPWYRALAGRPGVVFSANSDAGARDYERWMGLPESSVCVVRNAFVAPPEPEPGAAARWRAELGIEPTAPLVAGVFGLYPEKRPRHFLECVDHLRRRVPECRVVLAGTGILEGDVSRWVDELGLRGVVHLLGQRKDVPHILASSDVLLLTSEHEGTPNVVLEAQHFGCVPVVTNAGGASEALVPGRTGELVELDDLNGAVEATARLLTDMPRRRRMAEAGRAFVASRYSPDALFRGNERLYRTALAGANTVTDLRVRIAG